MTKPIPQAQALPAGPPKAAIWTQQVVELPPIMQQKSSPTVKHMVFEMSGDESDGFGDVNKFNTQTYQP